MDCFWFKVAATRSFGLENREPNKNESGCVDEIR
jgi:hypothetical protein